MPGKNRATGYSDFYKNKVSTPGENPEEDRSDIPETAEQRKKAIQRRLKRKRM